LKLNTLVESVDPVLLTREDNSIQPFILKQQWTIGEISILVTAAILNGGQGCRTQFLKRPTQGPSLPSLVYGV
jgi:hypothetical protein